MRKQRMGDGASEVGTVGLLGSSGSLRKDSRSTALLKAIAYEGFPDIDLSVKLLGDIPLYNEDFDLEPPLPSIASFRKEVPASDGVVIATPEYNHGIPGVLKNALDWASRRAFASCFVRKPVLIITYAPGLTGGVRAQYQLRETLISMHAHIVPGREIVLPQVADRIKDGRFADAETSRVIAKEIETLHEEIAHRAWRVNE